MCGPPVSFLCLCLWKDDVTSFVSLFYRVLMISLFRLLLLLGRVVRNAR
jgi:hypothetical protein